MCVFNKLNTLYHFLVEQGRFSLLRLTVNDAQDTSQSQLFIDADKQLVLLRRLLHPSRFQLMNQLVTALVPRFTVVSLKG